MLKKLNKGFVKSFVKRIYFLFRFVLCCYTENAMLGILIFKKIWKLKYLTQWRYAYAPYCERSVNVRLLARHQMHLLPLRSPCFCLVLYVFATARRAFRNRKAPVGAPSLIEPMSINWRERHFTCDDVSITNNARIICIFVRTH